MTDKAKDDNHIQRVPPSEERDPQKSVLPPDEANYRERSARERTSTLPPDRAAYRARSDRERTSTLPPDYHDPEKSALPPDKANHPETVVLPPEGEEPDQQKAERYYAEHVQLGPEAGGSSLAALQEALNKGARQRRKLVGALHDPTSQANVILVWDTGGFISG